MRVTVARKLLWRTVTFMNPSWRRSPFHWCGNHTGQEERAEDTETQNKSNFWVADNKNF